MYLGLKWYRRYEYKISSCCSSASQKSSERKTEGLTEPDRIITAYTLSKNIIFNPLFNFKSLCSPNSRAVKDHGRFVVRLERSLTCCRKHVRLWRQRQRHRFNVET